jgi:hypothetical protein
LLQLQLLLLLLLLAGSHAYCRTFQPAIYWL